MRCWRWVAMVMMVVGVAGGAWAGEEAAARPKEAVVAVLNGREIRRSEFVDDNVRISNGAAFWRLAGYILAQQGCEKAGILVTPELRQAERQRMLTKLEEKGVPHDQLEKGLRILFEQKGITPREIDWVLGQGACMRALAKGKGAVTEEMIGEAFAASYGERVEGQMMFFKTADEAAQFRQALVLRKEPAPTVADGMFISHKAFRLTPGMKIQPEAIKDAAFALQEGELSAPLPYEDVFVAMYVEKKVAQAEAKLEDVKEVLRAQVTERAEAQWGQAYLQKAGDEMKLVIKDPVLELGFQAFVKERRAAATQAGGTTTGPAPK